MEQILLISIFVSFILTAIFLPRWIRKCHEVGLLWRDMNKIGKPKNVAASGGVVVVLSFVIGVLVYIGLNTFILNYSNGITQSIFAILCTVTILAIVGLADDLFGWNHGGLSKKFRIFLVLMASIPLIVISAGVHTMMVPFVGIINFGLIYPLVLIPIGIVGATTTYNMLAGFNGLEAGQGIIILSFMSLISYMIGMPWLAMIGLTMVAALVVFYLFNRVPAQVFPGDSLTYSIGALIAIMAIVGNFEQVAIIMFVPFIIETFLKLRGGLKKQSFATPNPNGGLKLPYKKIYGLTHLSIFILSKFKRRVTEKDVVRFLLIFQLMMCIIAYLVFKFRIA